MIMTDKEKAVIQALIEAWNRYIELPNEHPDDHTEFRHGIHRLQEKIMARPGRREFNRGPGL